VHTDPKETSVSQSRAATPHLQTPLETVKSASRQASEHQSSSQASKSSIAPADKSSVGKDSSEEEEEGVPSSAPQQTTVEDSDEESEEEDDSMDMENYYSKEDIDKLMKTEQERLAKLFQENADKRASMIDGLRDEINGTINYIETSLDTRIAKKIEKITADVEAILQAKQREKSDLQVMNMKLINGIDVLSGQVNEVNESIESICTISLCLLESQCMQVRADEQDEEDK
jgi:hypothetical protein